LFNYYKSNTLPFAILYGVIVFIRNKFYDWDIFTSIEFSLPVICVGNITVGGTGKSPHIEYLIELLSPYYKVATLSRGYRRHSRGFKLANVHSDAREIGDEPFQFKSKYPQIDVAVAEERMTAIPQLLQLKQDTQIILLDDAFQHRTVRAGLNIVLTDYGRRYTKDYIMPFGLLRESRSSAARANIIVITKCSNTMTTIEKNELIQEINPLSHQTVYFSSIVYKQLYPLTSFVQSPTKDTEILLVTGIANADSLKEKLQSEFKAVYSLSFKDHHYFSYDDLIEIKEAFEHIKSEHKIIVTTEKDAARLMLLNDKIQEYQLPFFAQAIGIQILFDEQDRFNQHIQDFIHQYIPPILDYPELSDEADDALLTT
jgi:tetraacyldisaccharide 4'-kinase